MANKVTITGIKYGTTTITASYTDGGKTVTASVNNFKVTAIAPTLTFAAEDKEKSVAVTMAVVAKTMSYSQGRTAMKYHKIIIDTEYSTLNDTEKLPVNIEVSQASVSGDMVDALQKDPSATKTLTFNMYAPLPGEQPYSVKFKNNA